MSEGNWRRVANDPANVKVLGIIKCCANVRRLCDDEDYNDDGDDVFKGYWINIFRISRKYVIWLFL